eukprot:g19243.t1
MAVHDSESEIGAEDVSLDVAYTEDVDIFLHSSGAWAQPSDPTDHPKFTTEMGILGSCYDVSAEEQKLRARAQYEAKGFAHVIADRGRLVDSSQEVDPKNPFGMPSKLSKGGVTLGTVADYQNLSKKELNMIADSDEWATWLKEEMIRKGGLTALPEDSDGRAKTSDQKWLSETSPATHVWNSQLSNSDRLRSGDAKRKGDPTTFGWAGAGNASCEPQLADTNPLKFYSECPASLWDAVSDHAKKREHLGQLFVSASRSPELLQTSGTTRQASHDRALFVALPYAYAVDDDVGGPASTSPPAPLQAEAPQKTADSSDGIFPMVPADVRSVAGLDNTALGIFLTRVRHQTLYSDDDDDGVGRFLFPNMNHGTGLSLLGVYNALHSNGLPAQKFWTNLFAEKKVRSEIGEAICGLKSRDFDFVRRGLMLSDPDSAVLLDIGADKDSRSFFTEYFVKHVAFLHKLHEVEREGLVVGEKGAGMGRQEPPTQPLVLPATNEALVEDLRRKVRLIAKEELLPQLLRLWKAAGKEITAEEKRRRETTAANLLSSDEQMRRIRRQMSKFMSEETMKRWACFFGRVRVHDAYSLKVNLTPPAEGKLI